jgi:hypothetical protein
MSTLPATEGSASEPCWECHGKRVDALNCRCPECFGSGLHCNHCGGGGLISNGDAEPLPCPVCQPGYL